MILWCTLYRTIVLFQFYLLPGTSCIIFADFWLRFYEVNVMLEWSCNGFLCKSPWYLEATFVHTIIRDNMFILKSKSLPYFTLAIAVKFYCLGGGLCFVVQHMLFPSVHLGLHLYQSHIIPSAVDTNNINYCINIDFFIFCLPSRRFIASSYTRY